MRILNQPVNLKLGSVSVAAGLNLQSPKRGFGNDNIYTGFKNP